MKTIIKEYKVYSFDELSPEAKKKVIDDHRDINTDYDDWHDFIIEDQKARLESFGYQDPEILYSGFWSQGDGACFTCTVDIIKWIKAHDKKFIRKYNRLIREIESGTSASISITHNNYYYHERSTSVNSDDYENLSKVGQNQYFKILDLITVDREIEGNNIYGALEKEYDSLSSDESVIATIKDNDYQFTVDGTIFS